MARIYKKIVKYVPVRTKKTSRKFKNGKKKSFNRSYKKRY